MSMFWAMRASMDASAAASDAGSARTDARSASRKSQNIEMRLDRSLLTCEAMWSLMRDKLGLTDEALIERMNDIDLSDGVLDGKVRKKPMACPKCNRTISAHVPKCMYCGQPVMHDPFA